MSDTLPMVTVIVPTRPGQAEIPSVKACRALDYPPDKLEILVARGRQPAVQRNHAIRAAKGELLYFLDDDSVPDRGNLRRSVQYFSDPKVQMVSGPNLCPPDAPLLQQVFAVVHSSWLAFGPSRARYTRVGAVRDTTEKEVIGCNLMARRATMLELGGFHEALYPNEDHPLYIELKKRRDKIIYDPDFAVQRHPRPTLKAFFKMLMGYGRGRAEEFRLTPIPGAAPNFVPPLFCLYLVLLAVVEVAGYNRLPGYLLQWLAYPLGLYALAVLTQTVVSISSAGLTRSMLAMPLVVASHIFYGIGFWRGLFTTLKKSGDRPRTEVLLENFTR